MKFEIDSKGHELSQLLKNNDNIFESVKNP